MSKWDRRGTTSGMADEDWALANTTSFAADRRIADEELAAGVTVSLERVLGESG